MQKEKGNSSKHLFNIISIVVISLCICVLIFKAQVKWDDNNRIQYTFMPTHKPTGEIVLNKENPVIIQDFICRVPELRKLKIEAKAEALSEEDTLSVEIIGLDTSKTYYSKKERLDYFYNTKTKKKTYKLKGIPDDTEGMLFRLIVNLDTQNDTRLIMTSGSKPGTVIAVNGNSLDASNIVYSVKYGRVDKLRNFYVFLCIWLIFTLIIIYVLLFILRWDIRKWFPIAGILIGLMVQWVIPVYGVPDEPWHMDTAYQLANTLMRVDKEPQNGTILKRECDIIATDLLAYDVESNSYYQEWNNTLKNAENTELKRVAYVDSGNQVPDVVYLPSAIGIIIGRLIGSSGMMTYQLARIVPLLCYIMLIWFSIRLLPFCNSMTGMAGLSLIALQQAASASYDCIINGTMILFISSCLMLAYRKSDRKQYSTLSKRDKYIIIINIAILIIASLLIATVKGGVYLPLLLLLILPISRNCKNNYYFSNIKVFLTVFGIVVVIAATVLMCIRFKPMFEIILSDSAFKGAEGYTLSYAFRHPTAILYMIWRTIIKQGDTYVRGLFGGMLGWHNIKVSWLFIIPLLIGLVMLIHAEGERPVSYKFYRVLAFVIFGTVIILIMLALLFSETKMGKETIWGLQGRYAIPVEILILSAISTPMVNVKKDQAVKIIFSLFAIEVFALLEVVAMII